MFEAAIDAVWQVALDENATAAFHAGIQPAGEKIEMDSPDLQTKMKAPERKGDVQKKDVSGAPRSDALEMPVRNMQATEGEATEASKGTGISARSVGGLVDAVNQKKPGKIPAPLPSHKRAHRKTPRRLLHIVHQCSPHGDKQAAMNANSAPPVSSDRSRYAASGSRQPVGQLVVFVELDFSRPRSYAAGYKAFSFR